MYIQTQRDREMGKTTYMHHKSDSDSGHTQIERRECVCERESVCERERERKREVERERESIQSYHVYI